MLRVVLELGSGLGLVGLMLCKVCQPRKVILSDCHDEVIDCLINNIERNIGTQEEEEEETLSEEKGTLDEEEGTASEEQLIDDSSGGHGVIPDRSKDCKRYKSWKGCQLESLVQFNRSNVMVLKLNWETISDESLESLASQVDVIVAAGNVLFPLSPLPSGVGILQGQTERQRQGMRDRDIEYKTERHTD